MLMAAIAAPKISFETFAMTSSPRVSKHRKLHHTFLIAELHCMRSAADRGEYCFWRIYLKKIGLRLVLRALEIGTRRLHGQSRGT